MAVKEYDIQVGDKGTMAKGGSPRVAINRALVAVYQHNHFTSRKLSVLDNQIPRGETLVIKCTRRG